MYLVHTGDQGAHGTGRRVALWLITMLCLTVWQPSDVLAQRPLTLKSVQGTKAALPAGTRVAVLIATTDKKDPRGSWARLRIGSQFNEALPEASNARSVQKEISTLTQGGRTDQSFALTGSTRNVYFVYAITPDDKLYESVAWSQTRRQYEPAYERLGDGRISMRAVTNTDRITRVKEAFFDASPAVVADPDPVTNQPTPIQTEPEAELKRLSLEFTERRGGQIQVRLLPEGTEVTLFWQPAPKNAQGYTSISIPNDQLGFPEQMGAQPEYKRHILSMSGAAPDLAYPITDDDHPFVYFIYALTPEGQLYQSVTPMETRAEPAYNLINYGFVRMEEVTDSNRIASVHDTFFDTHTPTTETETVTDTESWPLQWIALGLFLLLGGGFLVYRMLIRSTPERAWSVAVPESNPAPLQSTQPSSSMPIQQEMNTEAASSQSSKPATKVSSVLDVDEASLAALESELFEVDEQARGLDAPPRPTYNDFSVSTTPRQSIDSDHRPQMHSSAQALLDDDWLSELSTGDVDNEFTSIANLNSKLKIFFMMDQTAFEREIDPLLEEGTPLEARIQAYRQQMRDSIEKLFGETSGGKDGL